MPSHVGISEGEITSWLLSGLGWRIGFLGIIGISKRKTRNQTNQITSNNQQLKMNEIYNNRNTTIHQRHSKTMQ